MPGDWQEIGEVQETPDAQPVYDTGTGLSDAGISAMQGGTDAPDTPQLESLDAADAPIEPSSDSLDLGDAPPSPPPPEPSDTLDPPPEHVPKPAVGEAGQTERIEEGAEKGEKENFCGRGPEGLG